VNTPPDIFLECRERTQQVLDALKSNIQDQLGDELNTWVGDHTCVYVTGSMGRLEMGTKSDLDAYTVKPDGASEDSSSLEAAVKLATAELELPPLDGAGKYLKAVSASELLDLLGSPRDDSEGVLTKRMLLVLESRVLLGSSAYDRLVGQVIDAYWQNAELHPDDYQPFVLVNDIIRYWRIVLLNHESKLRKAQAEEPDMSDAQLLAHRRYRSLKLRFPRCLSCFSALTYLLHLAPSDRAHISKEHVREMIRLSPLERLERLPKCSLVDELRTLYGGYLERNDRGKQELLAQLEHDQTEQQLMSRSGRDFTKKMFELVQRLGDGRALHRHMLV